MKEIFHSEAINRGKSLIWNAETREIESADDAYMNNTGDGIDDFDLLDTMGIEDNAMYDSNPQMERVERLFYGEESDSIGTLFTNKQNGQNRASVSITSYTTPVDTAKSENNRTVVGVGNNSIGGQSSATTFTNEEASIQIISLTEGFRNLERMFMAVMQQQGITLPATLTQQPSVVQPTPTLTQHMGEQQQTAAHASVDTIMENISEEEVDHCQTMVNQGNK